MKHFPIFLAVEGRRIVLAGGGDAALAKLRLLLKTQAKLTVIAQDAAPEIHSWAEAGKLTLIERTMEPGDTMCASLFYAAHEDAEHERGATRSASEESRQQARPNRLVDEGSGTRSKEEYVASFHWMDAGPDS